MSTSALSDIAATLAPFLLDTDTAAIHEATAGEIGDITAKAAPLIDDVFLLENAADAEVKASTTLGAMLKAPGQVTNMAAATILITDKIAFEDASDTLAMKEATVQEVFAAPGWVTGLPSATVLITDKVAFEDASASLAMCETTVGALFAVPGWVVALTGATPVAADAISFEDSDGSIKKTTFGAIPITQSQVVGILLEPAADAAVELLGTTSAVVLTVTGAATVVISNGAGLYAGQRIEFRAAAVAGGGKYTVAVQGGALTMDATGEEPVIMRNAANDAWVVVRLGTATIV
jgi:hypothetical protein